MAAALASFIDGVADAQLPLDDRCFQFGDGLFESLRYQAGRCPLWPYHLQRLQRGCERLGIAFNRALIEQYLQQLMDALGEQGTDSAIIKLQLSRGQTARGYAVPQTGPTIILRAYTAVPFSPLGTPLKLELSAVRLAQQPLLAGLKHCNRLEQVLAKRQLSPAVDDGILCDTSGRVIEAISSNIFIREGQRWLTPNLQRAGVAGVVRACLLERLGNDAEVADIELERLLAADEVFLCNSVAGLCPVADLKTDLGSVHWSCFDASAEVATKYQQLFLRGE
ncbi:MAG: aminodeoxychorismate lyase [Cellvibrionaceae bacterium]|nr:aminodeoxychorismate lyase [Cellvibrionaceae bacterium]